MEPAHSTLLCDEDAASRAFLADNLTADGYKVLLADSRQAALARLEVHTLDLVICDVNGDALGLLDAVRHADGLASRIDPDVPLIVLIAGVDELARVRYLDRRCDDVVEKPFSYPDLRGRIRAILRRTRDRRTTPTMRIGALHIDTAARAVRVDEAPVDMTAQEYALLTRLASDPTRVFTKSELLRDVWGFRAPGRTRTVDNHACRLRNKLGRRFVRNIWGVGVSPHRPGQRAGAKGQVGVKRGRPLRRRTPLRRQSPLQRASAPGTTAPRGPGWHAGPDVPGRDVQRAFAASPAQRAKIVGAAGVVCGLTPAHLAPRSLGGCDHPDCVVPLCWTHHRAYDTGRLELLPYLEPDWRAEVAHAVLHLGLIGATRRLRGRPAG